MRIAKWAMMAFVSLLGILVITLVIGFIYGIAQLGIAAVRMLIRRIAKRRDATCTK